MVSRTLGSRREKLLLWREKWRPRTKGQAVQHGALSTRGFPAALLARRAVLWIVALGLGGVTLAARAEPALTMEAAVKAALARAPELRAASLQEAALAARVEQARSAYWPRLSAEAAYSAHWPKNELPIELPAGLNLSLADIDDYHRVTAGLSLAVRLLDLSRGERVDAARMSQTAQQAKQLETRASLAYQVRAVFLSALFARDVQRIAEESLKVARAEEKRATLRAEVGTGTQVAVAQARVRVATLEAQYRQAESELQRYQRTLASLLGLSSPPGLQGELQLLAQDVTHPALNQAPTLVQLRATRKAAELSARSVALTFWPTLALFGKAQVEYPHAMKTEWGPFFTGGASLSWDFFDGGLRRQQHREAEHQARQLQQLTEAARQRLERQLIDVASKLQTARADLRSARQTRKQTAVYLQVARAAVEAGTGTELDVHTAELGLDQARIAVQKALLMAALAQAERLMIHGQALAQDRGGAS